MGQCISSGIKEIYIKWLPVEFKTLNDKEKIESNPLKAKETVLKGTYTSGNQSLLESDDDAEPNVEEVIDDPEDTVREPQEIVNDIHIEPERKMSNTRITRPENSRQISRSRRTKVNLPRVGNRMSSRTGENEDALWYKVEVLGKGKSGRSNEDYLNLRYQDGSESGVEINQLNFP